MADIVLMAEHEDSEITSLGVSLRREGYNCSLNYGLPDDAVHNLKQADLLLVELNGNPRIYDFIRALKKDNAKKVIALVNPISLNVVGGMAEIDDFILRPFTSREILARVRRALKEPIRVEEKDTIKHGDLVIDDARCEVRVGKRVVLLTFREYKLLKFLVDNAGRVFSRDVLLDRVWGEDYLGGDRTVDVHIRRLRSKLEDADHTFIDTMRTLPVILRKHSPDTM